MRIADTPLYKTCSLPVVLAAGMLVGGLPGAESREISEGVVLDYDSTGVSVGIDIDSASQKVDLHSLVLSKLFGKVEKLPA